MEKIIFSLVALTVLVGCASNPVDPVPGTKAIYKRYDIELPKRPELQVDDLNNKSPIGESVRAYQIDLTNLIEYSLQLENILDPIATSEKGYEVAPVDKPE